MFTSGKALSKKIFISSMQIRLMMSAWKVSKKVHVKNPKKSTNITLHSFHISLLVTTILEKNGKVTRDFDMTLEKNKPKFICLFYHGQRGGRLSKKQSYNT